MLDYLIVGAGLSGITVAEQLISTGKKILVYDDNSQASSTVAGGIFNPVILKRFTLAWNADEQLELAIPFYKKLEEKLTISLIKELPIYRKFHSVEEQNDWFSAMDKPSLSRFLDEKLIANLNEHIPSNFSFGHVNHTGVINTEALLKGYRDYLVSIDSFQNETFNYTELKIVNDLCTYKDQKARRIIFCDGFGLKRNPFFNYLPLQGNKGEYLIIRSEELQLKVAVKASIFILPLGNDLYKVGATYNNWDKTKVPTEDGKKYLLEKLQGFITCEFEVVDQIAGIRPATNDRKPLVGQHPKMDNVYVCNGFGSRGVLIAPTVASKLFQFLENSTPLPSEINIKRYQSKFQEGSL